MKILGELLKIENLRLMIKHVLLHLKFHTDEIATHWMATEEKFRKAVDAVFPGIAEAELSFWSLGQSLRIEEAADTLSYGCRGGRLDEHKLRGKEFQSSCSAVMFADLCKLGGEALGPILEQVVREDRKGKYCDDSIHAVLKQIHRMKTPPTPSEILGWGMRAYAAQYREYLVNAEARAENKPLTIQRAKKMIEKHFGKDIAKAWVDLPNRAMRNFEERKERMLHKLNEDRKLGTKAEFWRTFKYMRVSKDENGYHQKPENLPMVVMTTDSYEAMQSAIDLGAALVFIERTNGHIAIFTNARVKIDLSTVALALRQEELDIMLESGEAHYKVGEFTPAMLEARGHVERWPQMQPYWFLHDVPRLEANQLYCGAESANVVPSRIPLGKKVKIALLVLGGQYHPRYYRGCKAGFCVGKECPWYSWGLVRCRIARGEVKLAPSKTEQPQPVAASV